jgi:hypothetical protein
MLTKKRERDFGLDLIFRFIFELKSQVNSQHIVSSWIIKSKRLRTDQFEMIK